VVWEKVIQVIQTLRAYSEFWHGSKSGNTGTVTRNTMFLNHAGILKLITEATIEELFCDGALLIVSAALEENRQRGKNCRSGFQPRYGQVRDSGAPRRGWKPLLHGGLNDDHAL
jgi:hypothetical protein